MVEALLATALSMTGPASVGVYRLRGSRLKSIKAVGPEPPLRRAAEAWLRNVGPRSNLGSDNGNAVLVAPAWHDGRLLGLLVAAWKGADAPPSAVTAFGSLATLWAASFGGWRDPLTGLAGRDLLLDHLGLASQSRRCSALRPLLIYCDLDHLKLVNDKYGHDVGDELVRSAAQRLVEATRPGDTVARLGGDEFAVLCPDVAGVGEASAIAARLYGATSGEYAIGTATLTSKMSIGAVLGPFASPQAALSKADMAMYAAKRSGVGYGLYDEVLDSEARWRFEVQATLPGAIASGELQLYYQPEYRMVSGRLTCLEALLRWRHPKRGLLGPDQFLPLTERSGQFTDDLSAWALRRACQEIVACSQSGKPFFRPRVAVNISPRQLSTGNLPSIVQTALKSSGLDSHRLQIEVTETAVVADPKEAARQLEELRRLGVRVVLDDFGIAYSSLALLRDLPVDAIKVDRSFTARLPGDDRAESIVAMLVKLAHCLHAHVCAEGVENVEQLRALRRAGCDDVQGFLFNPPTPIEMVPRSWETWIVRAQRRPQP